MRISRYIGVMLLFIAMAATCWAQQSTSQVKGVVQDSSGAGVPGAQVKMTQTATGFVRTVTSGADGSYLITALPVGPYLLEVTKNGFDKYVQTGIVLQVDTNPTIDVTMQIGSVAQSVTVESNAAMVETQSTGVGQVTDSQRVVDLPLVGRNVTDLISLAGGATVGTDQDANSTRNYPTQQYSVAGGLADGTLYVLDGADHSDPYNGLNYPLPFPDAMQEFKIETSALPAQYGLHSAGVVNAVTKSGTNEWHGTAFEFVRNYDFDAKNFFSTSRDSLKRNQFGGVLGGPIKKDKLFFFAGYQQTINRQNAVQNATVIPTAAMASGDLSAFETAQCQGKPVTLPAPFGTDGAAPNVLPTNLINNLSSKLLQYIPVAPANDPCGSSLIGAPNRSRDLDGVAKVDYRINDKHSIFVRYMANSDLQLPPYDYSTGNLNGHNLLATSSSVGAGLDDLVQTLAIGDNYIFSSSTINSFRVTAGRTGIQRLAGTYFGDADFGVNSYQWIPIMPVTITGAFSIGGSSPSSYGTTVWGASDDVSMIHGNHQFGFGAEFRRWTSSLHANIAAGGSLTFNGSDLCGAGAPSGCGFADFLLGNVDTFSQTPPNELLILQRYFGLYFQDSWKVKKNLTVSYGVRWEPYFPQIYNDGRIYSFSFANFEAGKVSQTYPGAYPGVTYSGDPGFPGKSMAENRYDDFGPRLGFAWDPFGDGKMSVRASAGIFYDILATDFGNNITTAPPFDPALTTGGVGATFQNPWNIYPGGNPFPQNVQKFIPYGTYLGVPSNYQLPADTIQTWNLSVQRQFGANWMVAASYIGNHGMHLMSNVNINPGTYIPGTPATGGCAVGQYSGVTSMSSPCSTNSSTNENQRRLTSILNPVTGQGFGEIDDFYPYADSSYNGLLLSVTHRLSHGVTVNANYTWSHCLSEPNNNDQVGTAGVEGGPQNPNNLKADWGNCNWSASDHRNIFNLTAVEEMPKIAAGWMGRIANNWRLSEILTASSGQWLTVTDSADVMLTGLKNIRPNLVSSNTAAANKGSTCPTVATSCVSWLNPNAYQYAPAGQFGNLGPATVLGPGFWDLNVSLARSFHIKERHTIEARIEGSNIFNHFNPGNPSVSFGTTTFGDITTTLAEPGTGFISSGDPRIMQFALKYLF